MDIVDPRHGTYAGYQRHRKDDEVACARCLEANAAYTRASRADPYVQRRSRESTEAARRARFRLSNIHRDEYQRLYAEELTAIRASREFA